MTDVSKWMSPCVYWTVSLVWPGRRARAVTARQACRGRLDRSEVKRETLNLCVCDSHSVVYTCVCIHRYVENRVFRGCNCQGHPPTVVERLQQMVPAT